MEETGEPGETTDCGPTVDGRPLPCHMPTPGFELGPQRWQARVLALRYPCPFAYRNGPNKTFNSDIRVLDIFRSQKQIKKLSKKISSQTARKSCSFCLFVCLFVCYLSRSTNANTVFRYVVIKWRSVNLLPNCFWTVCLAFFRYLS